MLNMLTKEGGDLRIIATNHESERKNWGEQSHERKLPLRIRDLSVTLPSWGDRAHAVSGVSFSIGPNQVFCLVGESGSGKSVIARSILGLLPPNKLVPTGLGIEFFGEDLLRATPERLRAIRGRDIGMIFQDPMTALNPLMTIGQQIDELLVEHGEEARSARRKRILEMLDSVHLPNPERIYKAYPHELSGGQRQRAMIAQALILEPKLLIADEPTTALDVTTQAQILKLIRELQQKRATSILFITHDFGVVAEIADRVGVMRQGEMVEEGAAQEVLRQPKESYTQQLLASVPEFRPRRPDPTKEQGRPQVEVKDLRKSYGNTHALDGINMTLRRGSTLGVVGESGSGKSTLGRAIARLINVDDGRIQLDGDDITRLSRRQLRPYRSKMQVVFQDPFSSLNPRRTVGDLITQGPILNGVSREQAYAEMQELLKIVGLRPEAQDRYPHEFSGGQRQRVGIARALAMKPEFLIADEPVSALDVTVQKQVLDLLERIQRDMNLTMFFITHDLRVASQICDRLIVMMQGRIVEEGATADVFLQPKAEYTKALLAAMPEIKKPEI